MHRRPQRASSRTAALYRALCVVCRRAHLRRDHMNNRQPQCMRRGKRVSGESLTAMCGACTGRGHVRRRGECILVLLPGWLNAQHRDGRLHEHQPVIGPAGWEHSSSSHFYSRGAADSFCYLSSLRYCGRASEHENCLPGRKIGASLPC